MREISTLRKTDERSAKIITEFLQYYFYNVATTDYREVTDKATQCKGIDAIFDFNGMTYRCDEKAAIRYVNKPLHTYSFELSFIDRSGNLADGWLLNNQLENNSYLLVWIEKARKDILEDVEDIDVLTMALIRKEDIINYLAELGWTKDSLADKMDRIRENDGEYLGSKYAPCKFSYSKQLVEQPINVIIKREKLLELADFKDVIELE